MAVINVRNNNELKVCFVESVESPEMKKQHINAKHFSSHKSSWSELPLITEDSLELEIFPYTNYCSKPNHFDSRNKFVCPVVPGSEESFLHAVDYLKYIECDIGSNLVISVIDVEKEVEVSWKFSRLIRYFKSRNRKELFNQVSLELTYLPVRKKFKDLNLLKS
jgi:hypothetical protein